MRIASMLEHWWPGEFPAAAAAAYRMLLDRLPAAAVARALGGRAERGERFRPSAAELLGQLCGPAVAHPSPDEAWNLIVAAIHRVGVSVYDQRFPFRHQAAIDWLAGQDRVVAAFAASRGLTGGPGTLGMLEVGDPDRGGMILAVVKKDYRERLEAAVEREARGLEAVEDRELMAGPVKGAPGEGFAETLRRYAGPAGELESGS